MPNGYRRAPLPSPWRGAGAGIGSLLASVLTKPMREREEQEEQIREAYEQAKLTGDKTQLSKLREQYPKAVARFEKERGLTLPGVREVPEKQVEMPPFEPRPGVPMGISGAAVTMPGTETGPMPWPTTGAGMQVRGMREMMAGKPTPPFMKPDLIQAIRAVTSLPEEQRQEAWDAIRERDPSLPEMKFKAKEPEPVTPRETAAVWAVWPDMTPAESAGWYERRDVPRRAPGEPEPEAPRPLSVTDFANMFQVTPEQVVAYQFTKKMPAKMVFRTSAAEPKAWLMKWASQIAERTRGARKQMGEEPEAVWDVAKAIMNGTYNFEMYQSSLAVDEKVQSLKMMLQQARVMKPRNKVAEKQLSMQMAEELGIEWRSGTEFIDFLLSLVTPQYGQSVTQPGPAGRPTSDEEALKGGIR